MEIIDFKPEHAQRIELRKFDQLGMAGSDPEGFKATMDLYAVAGPAITVMDGDTVVMCGGVAIQPGRTGNAWMLTSPHVDRCAVTVARAAKRVMDASERAYGLNRIQTTVHERHDPSRKWLGFLGMKQESLMRKLFDDENYYMYARTN